MTDTLIAVTVGLATVFLACGAGACKYYTDNYVIEDVQDISTIQSIEDIIVDQMMQRDSDGDTEIDIKINIHTSNHTTPMNSVHTTPTHAESKEK